MSRVKNATRNMFAGIINKLVYLGFPFVIRAVIIQTLGSEYLGLSSLFTSILQVLNLAELGFSNAVIYNMYKPIAKKDAKTICALLNLYKKIYRVIGLAVLVLGLSLLPFLSNFISGNNIPNINIYILYLIYLFNTSLTYFLFAYKSALINAHQRNDIVSNVQTVTSIIQFTIQIFILVVLRNYYLYVLIQIITTIMNNIMVAYIAKKKYPNYVCRGEVSSVQKTEIRKKVTGLMIQKVCATTRNSFDSIFISAMLGLTTVAMYSNYYTIMSAVIGIMGIITTSITASIGNSVATESVDKNYKDMNKLNFIYMWISGWCAICLACLYQHAMKIWVGEELMFPYGVVILFSLYFYVLKLGDIRTVYVEACGLWYENRFRAIIESIMNLVLNLVLGYLFGVYGIIAATLISLFFINFIYGSSIIFKHYFKKQKILKYYAQHIAQMVLAVLVFLPTFALCNLIQVEGIIGLVIKGVICLIIPNALFCISYCKTRHFKESISMIKRMIGRK